MTCSTVAFHELMSRTNRSTLALYINMLHSKTSQFMSTHMFGSRHTTAACKTTCMCPQACLLIEKPSTGYQP
jgi:hypothetical protein